jgi:hypothetical protein
MDSLAAHAQPPLTSTIQSLGEPDKARLGFAGSTFPHALLLPRRRRIARWEYLSVFLVRPSVLPHGDVG